MSLTQKQQASVQSLPTLVRLPELNASAVLDQLAQAAGAGGVSYESTVRKGGKGDVYAFFPGDLNEAQRQIVRESGGKSEVTTMTDWLALRNEAIGETAQMAAGNSPSPMVVPQYE